MDYAHTPAYLGSDTAPGDTMHDTRRRPPPKSTEDQIAETLQRVTRLETRVTTALIALGHDTRAQKPTFFERFGRGRITLPSPHSSLRECLNAIPKDWVGPVEVYVGGELIASLTGMGNPID